jgi:hypothetical protein
MLEVEIADIGLQQVEGVFGALPNAWKAVTSWYVDSLYPLDSRVWHIGGELVGFSCWHVGPTTIIHTLSYNVDTKLSKNTINAQARIGYKAEFAGLFSEALHLAFENDYPGSG